MPKIVGVIGGPLGRYPFHYRSWSGLSAFFFNECQRQGYLFRAFGADLPDSIRRIYIAKNFSWPLTVWRRKFYMDVGYRKRLSTRIGRHLLSDDYESYSASDRRIL